MSANPTRPEWPAAAPGAHSTADGKRVLELVTRQKAMGALLAFSGLQEKIRTQRRMSNRAFDAGSFETERFLENEVLQLICDRVRALTRCDGVVIALAEDSNADRSIPAGGEMQYPEMVCRAAAGPLAILRGLPLAGKSALLRECLEGQRILRCDDCADDTRAQFDSARQVGALSTVLIALGSPRGRLGVLQAFAAGSSAFSDEDVRCFDLFSELLLSALKPEDQDRRLHWLSGIADEVLRPPATGNENTPETAAVPTPRPQQTHLPAVAETDRLGNQSFAWPGAAPAAADPADSTNSSPLRSILEQPSFAARSHPGLKAVLGLVAVVTLFSAGAWWGMQVRGKMAGASVVAGNPAAEGTVTAERAPAASDDLMDLSKPGAGAAVAGDKLAAMPKIMGVRHWSSSTGSTVVIDMEDQVPYEVHRLMSPERIYFDLHDTVLAPELNGKTMEVGDPSLSRVRVAQPVAGVTRIVLDTKDGSNFSVSMESNPYRLVVELRDTDKTLTANKLPSSPASPAPADSNQAEISLELGSASPKASAAAVLAAKMPDEPLPVRAFPAKTGKIRIVLDAGHGGWDLGTVGRQGLLEKDLVLDVTERLGKLLQSRLGSEVFFTRADDSYMPLEQRADFANQAQADLFVSVHANYSSSAAARGVETYYTNLFSAPGLREVEKHEGANAARLAPVTLSAGALHDKIEESRKLAASVQRSLYSTLAEESPGIRNRGIKDSAFVVLTGATMPAILTEISFVSSPADERNLQSANYRQQIAEALYKGIAGYQASAPHAKIAQLQKPNTR